MIDSADIIQCVRVSAAWFILVSATAFSNAAEVTPTNSPLNCLPWPKSVEAASNTVRLGESSRLVILNDELKPLADMLRDEWRAVVGLNVTVAAAPARTGDIVLAINKRLRAGEDVLSVQKGEGVRTRDGAYRLTVKDGVQIEGFDYRAVAEGTATLLQAVTRVGQYADIPVMTIHDWPHADYTAVMLDVARQANTLEDIRRCITVCRAFKVRYLQMHMTDDQAWTFPSTAYPKLGTMNGSAHGGPPPPRYGLAELKELVTYADARGVTLVPELETPGHSGNACGTLPEIFGYVDPATKLPVGKGMMNIANPKLYEALDTIIGEMCAVFASSPYVHIGFDEVSGLGNVAATPEAQAFMRKQGLKDAGELMTYFTRRVNDMVKKRGRKTIIWEGAANGAAKDIVHMTWDGGARTAERLVAQGITTITVPWNLAGVAWQDWTMYHSNGSVLKKGDPVLGAMLPLWEQKGEVHVRWLRGGVAKRQERTWGPDTVIEPANFERRAAACDGVLDRLLYGFAIDHRPGAAEGLWHRQISEQTLLSLPTWGACGIVRYTADGTEPTARSPAFGAALPIADNVTIKARLFDKKGSPAGTTWTQPYRFTPLTVQAQGLLPESTWFAGTATVSIASTMKTGKVRYTLDGSAPLPTSPVYAKPLALAATATINARWFDGQNVGRGETAAATYQKLVTVSHAAVNKPVTMTVTAKLADPAQNAQLLVDGILARGGAWGSPEVLRLGDSDLEAVIDLGAKLGIRKVVVRCIYCQEAGIYPAKHVEVSVSGDGQTFAKAGTAEFRVPDARGADGSSIREIAVETSGAGRYVKVVCKNNGQLPSWHNSPGVPGHLMLDEILVNPTDAKR